MRWNFILFAVLGCSIAYADELRLLDGRLVLAVPANWETQQQKRQDATELTVLGFPLPPAAPAGVSANAVIISQPNPSNVALNDLVSAELNRAKSNDPEFVLRQVEWESGVWAATLANSRDGSTSYVLYDHFAATPNAVVSIRVVLPMLTEGDGQWIADMTAQVNAFVNSVAVDGASTGKVKIEHQGNELRLRAPTK